MNTFLWFVGAVLFILFGFFSLVSTEKEILFEIISCKGLLFMILAYVEQFKIKD